MNNDKMRAVICTKYGNPEALKIEKIDKPKPKSNEILVKIFATAVTSSDTYIRRLNVLPMFMQVIAGIFLGFGKPRNPVLGMIVSGEVEEIGDRVTRFKKGDKVFGTTVINSIKMNFGTYADYKCLPEYSNISFKPINMDYIETASIAYGGSMALWCIEKIGFPHKNTNSAEGLKVLIYGASGSVGTALVQLTKSFGADVTGVCSTSNSEFVKSLGASRTIDYKREDFTNKGEKWDYIFDAVGYKKSKKYCKNYKRALMPNGRFHSVDNGSPKFNVEIFDFIKELAEKEALKSVVDRTYSLEQIVEAHSYVDQGHKRGNVIIKVNI